MAAKAKELRSKEVNLIGLSLEPDFNTPEFIKDATVKATKDNYNSYTPVDGYDTEDSIIHKFKRDNNLNFDKSRSCSTGQNNHFIILRTN